MFPAAAAAHEPCSAGPAISATDVLGTTAAAAPAGIATTTVKPDLLGQQDSQAPQAGTKVG
jgi:hypothetical protein